MADGSTVNARKHTHIDYDQTKPVGDTTIYNLPTTTTVSARVGGVDRDSRVTTTGYGTTTDEWKLRLPTVTAIDPSGLDLRTVNVYDANGLILRQRLPRDPNTDAPSTRETVYYTAGPHPNQPEDAGCGNKPQWVNLPCKVRQATQPTGSLPKLRTSVFEYNAYQQATKVEDWVDGVRRRITTNAYDGAARKTSEQIVGEGGGVGTDPARKTYGYDGATGRPTTVSTPDTTPARTITTSHDAVGRVATYTDADGAVTTTRYDLLGRATRVSDTGGGDRTISYDATTGRVAEIDDTALGRITARGYDPDGVLTHQRFETAGLDLIQRYDETGDPVQRTYTKTSNCSSSCDWLDWQAASSIHGQWLSQTGTDGARAYAYDAAGRVTEARDHPTGASCATRAYQYDADSNRTQLKTYPAAGGGACSTTTTPTTQSFSYDQADRITGSGFQYDDLGRIGAVPAASAGGTALTATYYTNDLLRSVQEGARTTTIELDPADRVRARTASSQAAVISHYADDGDEPAWTQQGSSTTRNLSDLAGDLAAVQTSGTAVALQLTDLHGDVVAEMPNSATASRPTPFPGTDEFGVPRPGAAPGQPIQKIGTSVNALTTPAASMSITKPAGTAPGDLLIAQMTGNEAAGIAGPDDWTEIPGGEVISSDTRYKTFYKVAGSSEPSSYTFLFAQSEKHIGAITVLRNTAQQNPIDSVAADYDWMDSFPAPSVTPSADNEAHLVFVGRQTGDSNGGTAFGFPSPLTTDWEAKTGTGAPDRTSGTGLRIITGGAGTPAGTVTVTNQTGFGTTWWGGIAMTIKPQSTGPTRTQLHYGYLGAKQRHTTTTTGAIEMGARVYLPQLGRFLQTDPIYGGSCNPYDYTCQNPVNELDLSGTCVLGLKCPKVVRNAGRAVKSVGKTIGRGVATGAKAAGRAAGRYVVRQARTIVSCGQGAVYGWQVSAPSPSVWGKVASAAVGCMSFASSRGR